MKKPFRILAVLAAMACFAFALPKNGEPKQINVVIDAGHGGKDHGAEFSGITEKEIVDRIAGKIKSLNTDSDVVIHFTRIDDKFVSLEDRVKAINAVNPDLVLSLHVNYTKEDTRSGMEFFVYNEAKDSNIAAGYAEKLAHKFEAQKFKVSDVQTAKFFMLNKSEAPSMLVELGYLSNNEDREYLTNDKKQDEIAKIVLDFLKEIK